MNQPPADLAIATVVNDAFLPGALVTLDSFRRYHRWFAGNIVVIHDDELSRDAQAVLLHTFDRVQFRPVRAATHRRLDDLASARPRFAATRTRFYSLEVFGLRDCTQILYCDADLLFQAPIDEFLQTPGPLVATPDKAALLGEKWGENAPPPTPEVLGQPRQSFNAGLMLVQNELLTDTTDLALQQLITSATWEGTTTGHTDQWVLNRHFLGQAHLADIGFNYLLRIQHLLEERCGLSPRDARGLHFNVPVKPWQLPAAITAPAASTASPAAERRWLAAYQRVRARQDHRQPVSSPRKIHRAAQHDLARLISCHLFIISPNNSGSTFLSNVLKTSRHTWYLHREGQHQFGVSGPNPSAMGVPLVWAAAADTLGTLRDPAAYNWDTTRRAWYFQALGLSPTASVFVEKSPPHLLHVAALRTNFHNAKFIFLVRNPYAVAEGILRRVTPKYATREEAIAATARHLLVCLQIQRENVTTFPDCSIATTYEAMCRSPEALETQIQTLVPALDDLYLDQTVEVKGMYHEPLRDMNAQQIARLSGSDLRLLQSHFESEADLLAFFGYSVDPTKF